MALEIGTRFGAYEVTGDLGVGGMGEVYRAKDTTLDRDVALKVLPESLRADESRVARFEQEAKTLASLNHANIAQIHGLERVGGKTAIVMELVEGPTLADRIAQNPIPPDEALNIAMQIADGLEAAHERGIVHRDLKPSNIKLKPDGTVKILDFGIAKAFDPHALVTGSQAPVMTTPVTQAGIILGTAAYMSPEQARGKGVDQRTDIWAFGCVLYEMLTGQPAFGGEDVPLTLARVLAHDTNMDSMPAAISPAVRQTLELCLRKDPRKRVADIRDVKLALQGEFDVGALAAAEIRAATKSPVQRAVPLVAAMLIGAVLVAGAGWALWPEAPPPRVNRFAFALPEGQGFRFPDYSAIDLSPDGRAFVYNSADGLHIRDMGALQDRVVPGTQEALVEPTFSPDGQWLAYFTSNSIKRIATTGGAAVVVAGALAQPIPSGLHWERDGTLLYSLPDGIYRVPATGGTPERIVEARDGEYYYGPQLLPDRDKLLFEVGRSGGGTAADTDQIVTQSLSTGERTVLVSGGADAHYLPTGQLVYAFGNSLFGMSFDPDTATVSGGAVPLLQGVSRAANNQPSANFAVADDGTLVYVAGGIGTSGLRTLVWVDRDGSQEPIGVPPRGIQYAQLSPDGTRVVLDIRDQENDTWVWDLERKTLQRLTFDPARNRGAVWSPDSKRVAFSREIDGSEEIWWQAADGSGAAEQLTKDSGAAVFPTDITPDGSTLLYALSDLPRDTFKVSIAEAPAKGEPLLNGPASEGSPTVSPDGRWLAYTSDESGQYEVYVRPFPDVATGRWQISTAGGFAPHWSPVGNELFYLVQQADSVALMGVPVESGSTFRPGSPKMLFQGPFFNGGGAVAGPGAFDVSTDGKRFLMIVNAASDTGAERPRIVIVQNWLEEVQRLVPTH